MDCESAIIESTVSNMDTSVNLHDTDEEETVEVDTDTKARNKNLMGVGATGLSSFAIVASIIAIVVVCATISSPSHPCHSEFQSLKDANATRINSHPYSVATGDLNNDNLTDIVVSNTDANSIGVLLSNANGTFIQEGSYTTGYRSKPIFVVLGDLNDDTYLDIIVANYDAHEIGIFVAHGNGTFNDQRSFSTAASRPISLAVGDLNNDQRLDLVIVNNGTNDLHIYYGCGDTSFVNRTTISTGYDSFPHFAIIHDFDHDQSFDIAVIASGTAALHIYLGNGRGDFHSFSTYSTGYRSYPCSMAVTDFNADGHADLAVTNAAANNLGIFLGNGNGSFRPQTIYSNAPGARLSSIVVGDFNGDKLYDVAASNLDSDDISIFISHGNGSFASPTTHSTGSGSKPHGISAADFDQNGQLDIVIANFDTNEILLLITYSMIQFQTPTSYSTDDGSLPYQIEEGDFNNDTHLDLAVVNYGSNTIGIFLSYGNGSFHGQVTYSTGDGSRPRGMAVSDVDRDGRLDVLVVNYNTESLGIFYGYGNGTFAPIVTRSTGPSSSARWIETGDFNNDGYLDIVFADYGNNLIGIYLGLSNRAFGMLSTYSCGDYSHPYSLAVADLNHDDRLDIVVANFGTENLVVFLGSGNGSFTLFTTYSTGNGSLPRMVAIADLKKNGHSDILVANSGSNCIGIFFGFGNGSFDKQVVVSTGSNSGPVAMNVVDFNNDSWLDLAVANSNDNNVGLFLGESDSRYFVNQTFYATGLKSLPYSVAAGDFNHDQRLDIAVTNYGLHQVAILLGHSIVDGSQTNTSTKTSNSTLVYLGDYYAGFQRQVSFPTGAASRPFSVAAGDMNNDSRADLVVVNSGTGDFEIFLGNANDTFTGGFVYSTGAGSSPEGILVADLNADGPLDIVITDPRFDQVLAFVSNRTAMRYRQVSYSTGVESDPTGMALGYLNDDRYQDLVVANGGTDSIGIFFGYDYTFFSEQTPCLTGDSSSPYSAASGDFNHDGQLDLAVALFGLNSVGVCLGTDSGRFTTMISYGYVAASHPWSVTVGDFNNDTHLDITVANWGVDAIAVVFGVGDGTFSAAVSFSTSWNSRPIFVTVADVNHDGRLDIAAANYGTNNIALFLGNGNGTFQKLQLFSTGKGSRPRSVTVRDLNYDTHMDLVAANQGANNIAVLLGAGNGTFGDPIISFTGTNSFPRHALTGHFNSDGHLDLAVANYGASNVAVLFGFGNGTFGNMQTYSTGAGSSPTHVNVVDTNKDNRSDVIVVDESSANLGVLFGLENGRFSTLSTFPIGQGSATYGFCIGDFNKDSYPDFAIADSGYNAVRVFYGNGSKPFGGQSSLFVGKGFQPIAVALARLNDDQHVDIAVANYGNDSVSIFQGDGDRSFSSARTFTTGQGSFPIAIAAADFNEDARIDLVVANSATGDVAVFLANVDGSFQMGMRYDMGAQSFPVSLALGDFNGDDRVDLVVGNYGNNNLCLLFGARNGTFVNPTWHPLGYGAGTGTVLLTDLNDDARLDIAVTTYNMDNVEILFNLC